MGLMDILNGMQNGPRGQSQPSAGAGGGSMSPMTMALLGLLAYKAVKGFAGASADSGAAAGAAPGGAGAGATGGLGDVLGRLMGGAGGGAGGLGGLIGGATAGSLVSNGLGNLLKGFQQGGFGQAAQSWVSNGPNEEIAPHDLAKALGGDTVDALTKQTGMSRDDLLAGLSQHLPDLVHQLTPDGRLPTHGEASRMG